MHSNEVATRSFDGNGDLVVVAPIREGFIDAFESITYETRARMAAEALHNIRQNVREFESVLPFADTTERILNVLDFRLGIIDKDLFSLDTEKGLQSRRYLFLAVTFDSGWEPYMRLIWKPLGDFLDVFFCNCEGYKPAGDTGFEEYIRWVRSAQVESAIFYAATNQTVTDQLYARRANAIWNDPAMADRERAMMDLHIVKPEETAQATRAAFPKKAVQMGLEALNVLYKLTDLYPTDRMDPARWPLTETDRQAGNFCHAEGRYLLRATRTLLDGLDGVLAGAGAANPDAAKLIQKVYAEPLAWFKTDPRWLASEHPFVPDPALNKDEVQAGLLTPFTYDRGNASHGAMLFFTLTDAARARGFLSDLPVTYEIEMLPPEQAYLSVAFTSGGLRRMGMRQATLECFPKEFRDGMEMRSGIIGDMRENHPRNWTLPARNWPPESAIDRPPMEMAEVDFVLQIRLWDDTGTGAERVMAQVAALAERAAENGAVLAAYQPMQSHLQPDANGALRNSIDHFGFRDGLSQPAAAQGAPPFAARTGAARDAVAMGEILCGHANDRDDGADSRFAGFDYMQNGSFMVVRKMQQHRGVMDHWAEHSAAQINRDHDLTGDDTMTPELLKAKILGRWPDGRPLQGTAIGDNDFDYTADPRGLESPLASHVRRSHPRNQEFGRPGPRILRRGMSFGPDQDGDEGTPRGLLFIAYNASIAEQYEVVQRWINGGNSTGLPSAQNDPLIGVSPPDGRKNFTFVHAGQIIRCALPATRIADAGANITAANGFTTLHWGLYTWVPSRAALRQLCAYQGRPLALDDTYETRGQSVIRRLAQLPVHARGAEWKRVLENFDTKDPTERYLSPDIWSAIRSYEGGALRIEGAPGQQATILVGGYDLSMQILANTKLYSSCEQTRRMAKSFGPNYVTMDGDGRYWEESSATNAVMYAQKASFGYATGYAAAAAVLAEVKAVGRAFGQSQVKLELRRQWLMPTLGAMCQAWFGLPGSEYMTIGGLNWSADRIAQCPGDFIAASRYIFNPDPSPAVIRYGVDQGRKIRAAGLAFANAYRDQPEKQGSLGRILFDAIADDDLLARNLTGMMLGMLAPIEANMRGVLLDWLGERTLWMHQAALHRASGGGAADYAAAKEALAGPLSRAMCKRPAPDVLYRTAMADDVLMAYNRMTRNRVKVEKGDMIIVGLVSMTQRSLLNGSHEGNGDASIVFSGNRAANGKCPAHIIDGTEYASADQPDDLPLHACPAQKLMRGAMMGMLAALLDAGRIQGMPAGLVIGVDVD